MHNIRIFLAILPLILTGCHAADRMWTGLNAATDHNLAYLTMGPPQTDDGVDYAMLTGYCYHTLAQVDCYQKPQYGEESRLVGYSERPAGQRIAYSALDDSIRSITEPYYRKRQQEMEDARRRHLARKALRENAPAPRLKPVQEEPEDVDPLELIRIRVGGQDYSFKKPPTEADIIAREAAEPH